jgi:hypothetical protein
MARDVEERPQFELQPRMQQLRLIAGLAVECDGVAAREFAHAETLAHQAHFRRPDVSRRLHQDDDKNDQHRNQQRVKKRTMRSEIIQPGQIHLGSPPWGFFHDGI